MDARLREHDGKKENEDFFDRLGSVFAFLFVREGCGGRTIYYVEIAIHSS